MAETYLSQAIEAAGSSGAEYDTNAKYLLADKQILARILKYTVKGFQNMPIENIISSIGDDIEVGTRPLDPGLSNLGRVNAAGTEDNIPGEGTIFYDIRFTAYIAEEKMKILLNVDYSDFRIIPIISCLLASRLYFRTRYRNNYCI